MNAAILAFRPEAVSRAMMRASGMRQYTEIRMKQPEPIAKPEYFMAALQFVGNISECGIPMLEEAAAVVERESRYDMAMALTVHAAATKMDCAVSIARESWIRFRLQQGFEKILMKVKLHPTVLDRLKKFLFEKLYP